VNNRDDMGRRKDRFVKDSVVEENKNDDAAAGAENGDAAGLQELA